MFKRLITAEKGKYMNKLLYIIFLMLLFSCKDNTPTKINGEGVDSNNNAVQIEEGVNFSVGNISFVIPNDYIVGYYDGVENKYVPVADKEITASGFLKVFSVLFFRKDSNFEDPDEFGYGARNLPVLIDYINGISEKKPDFFVGAMRRNTLKSIKVCETLTLAMFVIDNSHFDHQIIFVDDEYCYVLSINFWGKSFDAEIRRELPDHFNGDNWIYEKMKEIYDQFKNFQEMPEYIENLFIESNSIFHTIHFIGEQ